MNAINYVPSRDMTKSLTGCCAPFDPAGWDGSTFVFEQKPFVKFVTRSMFHVPLNMNAKMTEIAAQVGKAGATSPDDFMLSNEASAWKAEHYLAVTKQVPGADMVYLNGTYMSKVFEGPFKNMYKWQSELIRYVKSKNKSPIKTYFYYTMCPKCAKAYGHNYVVGFEQIS